MSAVSPSRAARQAAWTSSAGAVAFFHTVLREWELLCGDEQLTGLVLLPANCAASGPLALLHHQQLQLQLQQRRSQQKKHADSSALLGFQLFLLGASSDDDDGAAAAAAANKPPPPALRASLVLRGYIFVNNAMSPWFGGCFPFRIVVPPGYAHGLAAFPTVEFDVPLSHPELRNGRVLTAAAEVCADERRAAADSTGSGGPHPFVLRDLLDEVRALFAQPGFCFDRRIQRSAALDVKFYSVTSSYNGLVDREFRGSLEAAEEAFPSSTFLNDDDDEDDEDSNNVHSGSAAAARAAAAGGGAALLSPAQRFMKEEHQAMAAERKLQYQQGAGGGADAAPRTRPLPFLLASELGLIFSEAHVPALMRRAEQKAAAKASASDGAVAVPSLQSSSSPSADPLEARVLDETAWLTGGARKSAASALSCGLDAWMTRRLTRQVLPQVANLD